MSLLISENDTFEIKIAYTEAADGRLKFEETEGAKHETFVFRRPSWLDTRVILSTCVIVDAGSGRAIVDPYKMMDSRFKILIKDWSITENGQKVPATMESVNKLHPSLVQEVYDRLNTFLSAEPIEEKSTGKEPDKTA